MPPKNELRPVSMKDLAEVCGVSVVTVSRALKGDRNHSPETRAKVLRAAEMMGYRTNPLVSALMSARGRHKPAKSTVNLAVLNPGGDWPGHPFYEGVVKQARALGFSIDLFKLDAGPSRGRLREIMQSRGVKGVIVLPAPHAEWEIGLDLAGFAAATIGYSVVLPNMPRVVTDTYGRVMEALARVEAKGYRRMGFLGTDDLDRRFQHLNTAAAMVYRHTCRTGAEVICLNVKHEAPDEIKSREVLKWARRERLDVIISQINLHDELRATGLRIPEDIGYVHLHRTDDPTITYMDQNQEWIGRKATDVVVGMINRNEFQIPAQWQTIMIPSAWTERASLPDKRQSVAPR